jgi:cell division transport system permease protein
MVETPKSSGARTSPAPSPLKNYFTNHSKVAKTTLRAQLATPFSSFFTCAVIGIALVLPTLLTVLLGNVQSLTQDWDGSAQMTLLLKKGVPTQDGSALANTIATKQSVKSSLFVDNDNALASFKERFKFADAIDYLDENPLPHVILIHPHDSLNTISLLEQLKDSLLKYPEVDSAILDVMWLQRLKSITDMLQRAVWIIASMLSLAVILVLGNTIRLAIENRKEEIIVVKLVGGTDAFVQRPFLYMGIFLGIGASIIAWILIHIVLYILNEPVQALASSYQNNFSLSGLSFESTLFLFILGIGLGWLSSWLAVRKHLGDIEPT